MTLKSIYTLGLIVLATAGLSLAACSNTFHGAGKDIEHMGESVQDASK